MRDLSVEPVLSLPCHFGRYRLISLLAQGGMAQIYLAKAFGAEGFVKPLVIKRLTPSLAANEYFANLFVNEAKLLVTLTHGNIVPVFDFGRVSDDLYMAIEHVDGASLRQVMSALILRQEQLDTKLVAYIGVEICKGLGYAHRRTDSQGRPAGIVHRDIKPNNVLVSMDGEVKIVDFGVAKLVGRVEGVGRLTGTVAYMSPEQADRRLVDHRTDIFSTGLLLYELLTFRRAYDVQSPREALALARQAAVAPLPLDVPEELRDVISRATRLDPAERFASAEEMEMAMSDYLLRARASDGVYESPANRLAELMKQLPLERPLVELTPEDLNPDYQPLHADADVTAKGLEQAAPPDLNLIHNAAETFHSEFLTRVLQDEEEEPGGTKRIRPRLWLLVALPLVALLAVALGLAGHSLLSRPTQSRSTGNGVVIVVHDASSRKLPPPDAGAADQRRAPVERQPLSPKLPAGPPRRFGYLNLNSIPWSQVSIDGRPIKQPTPLLNLKLTEGTHTVVLTNKEQNLRKKLQVSIRAGATIWKVVPLK